MSTALVRRATGSLLAVLTVAPTAARAQAMRAPVPLAGARQLLLVTAAGWDDTTGMLRRYERSGARDRWRPVGDSIPVVLGRTGMAWGVGQGGTPRGAPNKREGDGRSPAGAFPLIAAFGYGDPGAAPAPRLPFHSVAEGTVCVDDPQSALYNAVADSAAAPGAHWASAERMRRVAGYRQGVVVGYNGAWVRGPHGVVRTPGGGAPRPGLGSCIFLHVWGGPGHPTEGCTAMDAPALAAAVAWLDPRARPVLVQMPSGTLAQVRARWALPAAP